MISIDKLPGRATLFAACCLVSFCGNNKDLQPYFQLAQKDCDENCVKDDHSKYLSVTARQETVIEGTHGKFSYLNGNFPHGVGIYVLSPEGVFYFKNVDSINKNFNHSYFLGGKPIAGAGWMIFSQGTLTYVDNASGHYKPNAKYFWQTMKILTRMGVELAETEFRIH